MVLDEYMHSEMERDLNEDVGKIFLGFLRIYWRLCEQILSVGEYKMLNKSHVNYNTELTSFLPYIRGTHRS